MKLMTMRTASGPRAGAVVDDYALDLGAAFNILRMVPWAPRDVGEILQVGDDGIVHCARAIKAITSQSPDALKRDGILVPLAAVHWAPPVLRPGMVMLAGRSYHSHIEEMQKKSNSSRSITPKEPNAFNQNPNSIIASGEPILLPADHPAMVDYEAELAVVFGRRCHNVCEEEALAAVAGFTLMNDVSARDWNATAQSADGTMDFTKIRLGKQFPTFCPVGPWMTTIDEFPDLNDISFTCAINGEVVQRGHTSDLVFSIARTIAYYAQWHVFEPGDIFSMGTPAGVGHAFDPARSLTSGDVIEISGPGLGTLRNTVEAARP